MVEDPFHCCSLSPKMVEVHNPLNPYSPKLAGKPFYYREMSKTQHIWDTYVPIHNAPSVRAQFLNHHLWHSGIGSHIFGESDFQWKGSMTKSTYVSPFRSTVWELEKTNHYLDDSTRLTHSWINYFSHISLKILYPTSWDRFFNQKILAFQREVIKYGVLAKIELFCFVTDAP